MMLSRHPFAGAMRALPALCGLLLFSALPAGAQRPAPTVQRRVPILRVPTPGPAKTPVGKSTKKTGLNSAQRLQKSFEIAKKPDPLIGVVMHTLERGLQSDTNATELDKVFDRALARHPGVSKDRLRQLVADYKAVPLEAKLKVMPRELATLDASKTISREQLKAYVAAPSSARLNLPQVDRPKPATRVPDALKDILTPGRPTPRSDDGPLPIPLIGGINARAEDAVRILTLRGTNFAGSAPVAVVHLRPKEGQSMEESGSQIVDGEKVIVAVGRVLDDTRVEARLPVGILPGKYDVNVLITKRPNHEETSPWFEYAVSPFNYRINFQKIHCDDESDPEWGGNDEIVTTWAVYADGDVWAKATGEYTGFSDGDTQDYNLTDSRIFMIDKTNGVNAYPGAVSKEIVVSTQLYEWDAGDAKQVNEYVGFIGDVAAGVAAAAGYPEVSVVIEKLVPVIQKVVTWLGGNPDDLGRRDLVWTAADLQEMTDNADHKYNGVLQFANDDDTGSYTLNYEVVRVE